MRLCESSTTATTTPETIDEELAAIVGFKWHAIELLAKNKNYIFTVVASLPVHLQECCIEEGSW